MPVPNWSRLSGFDLQEYRTGGESGDSRTAVFLPTVTLSITLEQPDKKLALFGAADRHLRMIRDTFGVQLVSRDDELRISGESDSVSRAAAVLERMQKKLRRQDWLSVEDVGTAIGEARDQQAERVSGQIDV